MDAREEEIKQEVIRLQKESDRLIRLQQQISEAVRGLTKELEKLSRAKSTVH